MAFNFQCPHCGATSRVQETSMGESGLCYQCGGAITAFPPNTAIAPPRAIMEGLIGASTCGAIFFAIFFSLRSIPMWVAMNSTGTLTTMEIVGELLRTLMPAVMGVIVGGLGLFSAAAIVHTHNAFRTVRRAMLFGAGAGVVFGVATGIVISMRNPSIRFFPQGELISAATCCGIAIFGFVGGAIGLPIAARSENKIVQRATFTVPKPADLLDEPVMAEVVETTEDPATSPRAELSSQRRQELIRRLGVVHAEEPSPAEDDEPA